MEKYIKKNILLGFCSWFTSTLYWSILIYLYIHNGYLGFLKTGIHCSSFLLFPFSSSYELFLLHCERFFFAWISIGNVFLLLSWIPMRSSKHLQSYYQKKRGQLMIILDTFSLALAFFSNKKIYYAWILLTLLAHSGCFGLLKIIYRNTLATLNISICFSPCAAQRSEIVLSIRINAGLGFSRQHNITSLTQIKSIV